MEMNASSSNDIKIVNGSAEAQDQSVKLNEVKSKDNIQRRVKSKKAVSKRSGGMNSKTSSSKNSKKSSANLKLKKKTNEKVKSVPKGKNFNLSKTNLSDVESTLEMVSPFFGEEAADKKIINKKLSLLDLARNNTTMLTAHYKLENKNIINTAALALSNPENYKGKTSFNNKFGDIKSSLKELEPCQKLVLEEDFDKLFSKETVRDVFSNLETLDMTANVALQSLILTAAISLTGNVPSRMNFKNIGKTGRSKTEVQRKLSLLLSAAEILYQRSKDFKDLEANKVDKMHKDLLKIVADY